MYAKLVLNSYISPIALMRDIGRLITSSNPSVSLLSGFSNTTSVIIDNTPAGWTYVGSNMASDRPTIADVAASTTFTGGNLNLCFSAPCLESSNLKYITINNVMTDAIVVGNSTYPNAFVMSGASFATSLGVVTNEGPRLFNTTSVSAVSGHVFNSTPGLILHVIASPRHVTLIGENIGINAVWESSQTDVHSFQNIAPFVQYTHLTTASSYTVKTLTANGPTSAGAGAAGFMSAAFNVTDVNTGTVYGSAEVTEAGTVNRGSFCQTSSTLRSMSINAAGMPVYQISPVFYSIGARGYPVQYVSGVVPIYWTKGGLGTSGDTVDVGGDTYTFFNANSLFGVILKTS